MYETETYELILQRMLDRVPESYDKRPSSVIYDTHSSTAIELQILYIELEYLIKNSYGDTAAREFLVLLCGDRGITPEPATKAILKGEFTPVDIDVTGQRFNIGEINYIVTEQIEPGQYQVQCETAGAIGNQYLGAMIPMEYIQGLETAELTEILIPGEDEEDTEVLRQRYFDSFNERAFGGNRADYLTKVRSLDGIGNCKVTRIWNGDIHPADMIPGEKVTDWYNGVIGSLDGDVAKWLSNVYMAAYEKKLTTGGTVLVTVVNSLDFGEVNTTLLQKVQNELDPLESAGEGDGLAPIGHVVSVKSAEPLPINVTISITYDEGYSWNTLHADIEAAVNEYLLELRKEWADNSGGLIVRTSQVEAHILAIKGIADVQNTQLNGSLNNMNLGQYQIPVLGGVNA